VTPDLVVASYTIGPAPAPGIVARILAFIKRIFGGTVSQNPTNLAAAFDKPSYALGEPMNLLATATAGVTGEAFTATVVFTSKTDPSVTASITADASVGEPDQLTASVTDSMGRAYAPGPAVQKGTSFSATFQAPA
jgi:hypothetical protein